jgi:predicted ATPase
VHRQFAPNPGRTTAPACARTGTGDIPIGHRALAKQLDRADYLIGSLTCLGEAQRFVETTDERRDEAELNRLQGDLLVSGGDRGAAEQCYHQALTIARRQSVKLFELRAAASLARLWRDQGKRTEARDLLAPIYDWFTEGFDTPVLKDAKALLDELV